MVVIVVISRNINQSTLSQAGFGKNKTEEREAFYLELSAEGIESDVSNVNACPNFEAPELQCYEDKIESRAAAIATSSQPSALTIQTFVYSRRIRQRVESDRNTQTSGIAPQVRFSGFTKFGWTQAEVGVGLGEVPQTATTWKLLSIQVGDPGLAFV